MSLDPTLDIYNKIKRDDNVVNIRDATVRQGEYTQAYSLGYIVFDEAMKGGVREGDFIVVTGLSGQGKTTFCQNISLNLSKQILPSIWFSYEVIIDNMYAKLKEMGGDETYFHIYTPKKLTTGRLDWIKDKIKEGYDKESTKFVFIDHLDFIFPARIRNGEQERIVIRNICTELKQIAIELKVVIFLMAHVKKVQGRAVELQDLAESGGTYKLADYVFTISRSYRMEKIAGEKNKIEVFEDKGMVRLLKNRLTGEQPMMIFSVENNLILPCPIQTTSFQGNYPNSFN